MIQVKKEDQGYININEKFVEEIDRTLNKEKNVWECTLIMTSGRALQLEFDNNEMIDILHKLEFKK